jgi:heptosyltransferase-2
LAALRKNFPAAHIEVLGYPHIIQLAVAGGLVNRAQSIEARSLAGFFAHQGALAEDLVDYFSEFDLIISYLYDPDHIFETNVRRCTPGQFLVGPHRPDERTELHATRTFLKPLERLAIFDADEVPRLEIGETAASGHCLALHPGSGSERKNWPEARWAELLAQLVNSTTYDLLLVGGEAEGERLQRLAAALPISRTRVAQSRPLTELAILLRKCAGFVGHDSGISHLASALGVPSVILWGGSTEAVWRPQGAKVRVVRDPAGLKGLSVEAVLQEIRALLGS